MHLALQGARVVVSSRKAPACEEAAAEIRKAGGEAIVVPCNISDKAQVENLIGQTRKQLGPVDVLVCNAATNPYYGSTEKMPDEAFTKIMHNNILSNIWLINLCVPDMRAKKDGSVIIVSSIGGVRASTVIGAYCISKAADMQLARNLAAELAPTISASTPSRLDWSDRFRQGAMGQSRVSRQAAGDGAAAAHRRARRYRRHRRHAGGQGRCFHHRPDDHRRRGRYDRPSAHSEEHASRRGARPLFLRTGENRVSGIMQCASCHSEQLGDGKFCNVCGAALSVIHCAACNAVSAQDSAVLRKLRQAAGPPHCAARRRQRDGRAPSGRGGRARSADGAVLRSGRLDGAFRRSRPGGYARRDRRLYSPRHGGDHGGWRLRLALRRRRHLRLLRLRAGA